MSNVSVRNLDITFGATKVITNLDLEIAKGEFLVLLGSSGCGKSTLLNSIAGLLEVSAGQIWIGEKNVTWAEPKDRGIGMVFQSYALYPRMTVGQNMSFGLQMAGMPKEEITRRVEEAARMLQLKPLMTRRPSELSGGQRQRVAIGRALVRDAGVYLFDEPLSNLDAKLRTELRVELKKLHASLGSTMIYVTHDQIEALTLADRIAVMQGGVIQQLASPAEIYETPVNRFVAGFVGSPGMNFLEGRFKISGDVILFSTEGGELDVSGYGFATKPGNGQTVTLGIRPEQLSLEGTENRKASKLTVSVFEPMGADTLIWGTVAGQGVSMRIDGERRFTPAGGDMLDVFYRPDRLSMFDQTSGNRI
ncbi:sn-glycerol-3-phosphate ABC transporter ATP-binding protein UgpC [Rhizobium sp. Root1204]|uniref:ABC transporter ATP-binding protein n=1 Tax=Rhizobium sp. Root1204 TaxID=1736428 RepID=UPI000714A268|nr:sn-glycerol-3-phosphate ABC transporter ATP-binding protein UgpC [Rhizobium sp. Root1204]KQV41292.1 ABC transporter ATP-binding protein [Rhizobium sp. Root1204]